MLRRLYSWAGSALRRLYGSERGATAIEFALVGGPFIYVLGCICETGLMLFTEYVLQNATQEAARSVRTGQASVTDGTPSTSAAAFKSALCEHVMSLIDCNGKVTVYVNNASSFAALETAIPDPVTIGPSLSGTSYPTSFNPGGQLKAATVIATYDWDFVFPFMSFLGNVNNGKSRRVYGLAIFRNEPF